MSIHHHETQGLFGGVIGGLDFRVGINEPVNFAVGIVARLQDRVQCGIPDLGLAGSQDQRKSL